MKFTYRHTVFACYIGYITQAIINNLAPLLFILFQNQFGLTFEQVGRIVLFNFAFQIIVDILAVKYVDRIGYRKAIVLAHLFAVAGLISLSVLPNVLPNAYMGILISVMIYAIGGGLLEVLVSPIVESLPGDAKDQAMSLLHSFYCWGQVLVVLVTTLLLKIIGINLWAILPFLWAVIPLGNLLFFAKVPIIEPKVGHEKISVKKLLLNKQFFIALVLMVCAGASEITMSQWSSLFAEAGLKVSKVVGDLLGPCLFAVLMGTGRALYGVFGNKIPLKKVMFLGGILCIICYALTVFSKNPFVALMGCAVCGLSVSLFWPGTFSMTAQRFPAGGTAMFGLLAVAGDIGASMGPWIAGIVSDSSQMSPTVVSMATKGGLDMVQMGLKCGLLAAIVFPIIMCFSLIVFREKKKAIL